MNTKISGKFQVALFLCFLSLYTLTMKGICTGDNVFHYERIQNIIKKGTLDMPGGKYDLDKQKWLRVFMAKGKNGKVYLTLGDGLSIAALPSAFIGNVMEKIIDVSAYYAKIEEAKQKGDIEKMTFYLRKLPSSFFSSLINPIIMALTVLVFFNFCLRLTKSLDNAFITSILLGSSTIIWAYSSTFWTQPIVTFCLFSAFYFLFRFRKEPNILFLLSAGALLGFSFITRYASIISAPFFALYIISFHWREKRKILFSFAMFMLPFVFFLLLQMGWNFYRFGSLLSVGAKHQAHWKFTFGGKPYISLPAMLIGLSRSIFVFSPPLILFFFGIKKFFNKHRIEAIALLGIIIIYFLFYSKFSFWMAPSSWGPRFLVPMTPFVLLPACLFIEKTQWKKIVTYTLLILGIFVQLIGVLLPLQTGATGKYFGGVPKTVDYFMKSEIIPQTKMLFSGNIELWFRDSIPKLFIGIILMIVCLTSLYYCILFTRQSHGEWGQG